MKTFTFKGPDNKTHTIRGPDDATPEQAFSLLQQRLQDPKSTMAAALVAGGGVDPRFPMPPAAIRRTPPFMFGLEQGYRGVHQVGRQLGERLGFVQPQEGVDPAQAYVQHNLADRTTGGQIGIALGQAAPYVALPGGVAGRIGQRVATGAAAGGTQHGLRHTQPDESRMQGMGAAATMGAAVPLLFRGGESMLHRVRPPAADPLGKTLGQQTRNPQQWTWERNLAKRAGAERLAQRFDDQLQAIEGRAEDFMRNPNAPSGDAGEIAEMSARLARSLSKRSQRVVSKAYKKAASDEGHDLVMNSNPYRGQWEATLDDFENALPADVRRQVGEFFYRQKPAGLGAGGEQLFREVAPTRDFSPDNVNKAIKLINTHLFSKAAIEPAVEAGLNRTKSILDKAMRAFETAEDNVAAVSFRAARKAAAERFAKEGPKKRTSNLVLSLLNDDKSLDNWVKSKLMTAGVRDVNHLFTYLSRAKSGEKVLAGLQREVDRVLYRNSERSVSGSHAFSPNAYARHLENIGPRKLEAIFGTEGAKARMTFAREAVDLTSAPASSATAINVSNTAPTWMAYTERLTGYVVPVKNMVSRYWIGREVDKALGIPMATPRDYATVQRAVRAASVPAFNEISETLGEE